MGKASRRKRGRLLTVSDREAGGNPANNYMKKLEMMLEAGACKPGQMAQADIYHESDCPVFSGGLCTCNPEITIKPLTR